MTMSLRAALVTACTPALLAGQAAVGVRPPDVLPAPAVAALAASLDDARAHRQHVWRDPPPLAPGELVQAYIEIPRGERRKWELDMAANRRAVDRVMPPEVGGYPVNYGFVPQTVSYDGDPFDALVLGPPLPGGQLVRGAIVGLMLMADENGPDSKVVLSPVGADGRPVFALTGAERNRIGDFFRRYKLHETGKFSQVPGWGSPADGRAHVTMTHAFFRQCRSAGAGPCRIDH